MGTARLALAGAGTQTEALAFGGSTFPPAVYKSATEEYNGTSWSPGGSLSTARGYLGAAGTQTAGLAFGGQDDTANIGSTEEYNGSTWSQ
jgi:hypothetical protein